MEGYDECPERTSNAIFGECAKLAVRCGGCARKKRNLAENPNCFADRCACEGCNSQVQKCHFTISVSYRS